VINRRTNRRIWMTERLPAGDSGNAMSEQTIVWDGRDEQGQPVEPGQYAAVLVARDGAVTERKTMSLVAVVSPEWLASTLGGVGKPVSGGGGGPSGVATGAATGSSSLTPVAAGSDAGAVPSAVSPEPTAVASTPTPAGGSAPISGDVGQPSVASAPTGTHDNGMGNGKNPKDFERGSNPGKHGGNGKK
jgi:hypothetical protein